MTNSMPNRLGRVSGHHTVDESREGDEEQLEWEVKTDDFMPYSDCEMCFWTGYFTSRAELKKWERTGSSFLQAARQLEAMDGSGKVSEWILLLLLINSNQN